MSGAHAGEYGKSLEYETDFFYFMVHPGGDRGSFIYCSGANLYRFLPITRGRHGLASNPTLRGLQLVNLDIRVLARSKGITMKALRGNECASPVPLSEGWYREVYLLGNATDSFPAEVIDYGAINLMKKIVHACLLEDKVPDKLSAPAEMQAFVELLCNKYQGNHDLRHVGRKASL